MLVDVFVGVMIVAAIGVGVWLAWYENRGGKK